MVDEGKDPYQSGEGDHSRSDYAQTNWFLISLRNRQNLGGLWYVVRSMSLLVAVTCGACLVNLLHLTGILSGRCGILFV